MSGLWHPFTQHGLGIPEIEIARAEGAYLYTPEGRAILDGISSWWVTTHGHCHPKIVAAVKAQADTLDQVIFAGFTHAPAQEVAQRFLRLIRPTMPALSHVFLSDSGSTAVEVGVKMAIGYHAHKNTGRTRIIALEGGYHGDTFGAMALSQPSGFTAPYERYLFNVERISPPFFKGGESLEDILRLNDTAALIVEPLVQGAGGMRMYSADTLREMYELCQKYGALFIADEVMTGWGRTGNLFACEAADITPDILCSSKGITGGFLPMGATVCTDDIYQVFYSRDRTRTFFHSTSYTGNALACAAAAANMALWEEEDVMGRIETIAQNHKDAHPALAAHPHIHNVRTCGTILALEIGRQEGYFSDKGTLLYGAFLKYNTLLRPLGNTVYVLPPYCITSSELKRIYATIVQVADSFSDEITSP